MDLHAGQMQGFFSKTVDHMTAMPILTQFVNDRLGEDEDLVIIAPDAGRVKLVRNFARKVGAPYALLEKERPAQSVAEIGYVIGDVQGKCAVIVDDIIGTGGTLVRRRADRARRGRREGLRGRHARPLLRQRLRDAGRPRRSPASWSPTPCRCATAPPELITQLTCADILEDTIRRIFTDDSVSEIFAGENQLF